jgi:hypothetical protein
MRAGLSYTTVGESEVVLMNRRWIASLFLLAAAAVWESPACRAQAVVDLSVNVFPTVLANPNGGGTWNIVAKTSGGSPNAGIAAISVYLHNINTAGITVEPDLNSILDGDGPFNGVFNGAVNILYGQDISTGPPLPPPLVGGVGMPAMSDGPDPLGDLFWDGAVVRHRAEHDDRRERTRQPEPWFGRHRGDGQQGRAGSGAGTGEFGPGGDRPGRRRIDASFSSSSHACRLIVAQFLSTYQAAAATGLPSCSGRSRFGIPVRSQPFADRSEPRL